MKYIINASPLLKDYDLRDNFPVVIRVRNFNDATAKDFTLQMAKAHNTGQPVVPVIIDSYGGAVYSLMSMISDVRSSKLPVATIVQGKAMSCGAIFSTFGTKGMRYMDPHATVMIHDVSSGAWGKIEEIKADAKEAERLQKKVYYMMAENCGKSKNYFLKLIHEKGHADWYLEPDECLEHGLIDHVDMPQFDVNINVEITFGTETGNSD
jgi:ATP-dependent Clp protease protease subunit